jgi:hypothetical protein
MMRLPDNSARLQMLPVNCLEGLVHNTGLAGGFDLQTKARGNEVRPRFV